MMTLEYLHLEGRPHGVILKFKTHVVLPSLFEQFDLNWQHFKLNGHISQKKVEGLYSFHSSPGLEVGVDNTMTHLLNFVLITQTKTYP